MMAVDLRSHTEDRLLHFDESSRVKSKAICAPTTEETDEGGKLVTWTHWLIAVTKHQNGALRRARDW
ncbi:hypothetical protein AGABI1DRAFT_112203 [Agaricus bisporus var. burnettii JB137-S8]|uniref:Uncharacterized protein n=1 Tax=Agaricus bisporus var. burnettii (strain JB137-S8 / ATCC MYA-4627 / FGSC 10392) TaxID=597362 RepID=K5XF67_AGABU|nr:uncharacterized protein AGABI1DRAFT_112203 [Agaricus bisporus var. burnettii JB137-S8]EKM82043.1 hypothetical protein AGABI1DRAFT_112203 [Agaricus bisporus var. burnettii JB137-S8]